MSRRLLRALPLLLALAGCSKGTTEAPPAASDFSPDKPRKVTLQLNWYPEAEHGGFYAALVNGYYREAGLDVEILPGGAETPVAQRVASGQVDFGVENADRVLLVRAQEADLVAVMAPMQTSPRCVMVHASTGAKSFADLGGFTVAMNAGEPFAAFLMQGPLPKDVRVVPFTGGVTHFLRDKKNAQQGYSFSEPFLAEERGEDPKPLLVADAGFNPYTSCLIASGKTVKGDPELVRRMVAASVRGWKEYLRNPTPTNAEIHRLNPEMSLDILAYGAEAMRPLCVPEGESSRPFGRMTPDRWKALADVMTKTGSLEPGVDPAKAFAAEFVPNEPGGLEFPQVPDEAAAEPGMVGEE